MTDQHAPTNTELPPYPGDLALMLDGCAAAARAVAQIAEQHAGTEAAAGLVGAAELFGSTATQLRRFMPYVLDPKHAAQVASQLPTPQLDEASAAAAGPAFNERHRSAYRFAIREALRDAEGQPLGEGPLRRRAEQDDERNGRTYNAALLLGAISDLLTTREIESRPEKTYVLARRDEQASTDAAPAADQ